MFVKKGGLFLSGGVWGDFKWVLKKISQQGRIFSDSISDTLLASQHFSTKESFPSATKKCGALPLPQISCWGNIIDICVQCKCTSRSTHLLFHFQKKLKALQEILLSSIQAKTRSGNQSYCHSNFFLNFEFFFT